MSAPFQLDPITFPSEDNTLGVETLSPNPQPDPLPPYLDPPDGGYPHEGDCEMPSSSPPSPVPKDVDPIALMAQHIAMRAAKRIMDREIVAVPATPGEVYRAMATATSTKVVGATEPIMEWTAFDPSTGQMALPGSMITHIAVEDSRNAPDGRITVRVWAK